MKKIKLKVHPMYIVFGLCMALIGRAYFFAVYTLTLVVHEAAHALSGKKLGYSAEKISLMPYGAALSGTYNGISVRDETIIAFAGPAVNLIIAAICAVFWWIIPESFFYTEIVCTANLVTAGFNLIPAYPLDGGRVLLSVLSLRHGGKNGIKIVKILGVILSGVLLIFYIVSLFYEANFTLAIVGIFLMQGALFELGDNRYNIALASRYHKKRLRSGLPVRTIYVAPTMTLQKLLSIMNHNFYYIITVVDDNLAPLLTITQSKLHTLIETKSLYSTIGSIV